MTYLKRIALWLVFAVSVAWIGPSLAQQGAPKATKTAKTTASTTAEKKTAKRRTKRSKKLAAKGSCDGPNACIGMVIDSGDPVLIQMGHEMSNMVSAKKAGTVVKPTEGPIANVRKLLSKENAGLSVVPSDMLKYTARSEDPKMRKADQYLRFIMTIGQKVVHVIARKDIRSIKDLDGKRVVMGPDNTALWVVSNNLLHLHGVTPSKRIKLKPPVGLTAVLKNDADAVFVGGRAPVKLIQRLSTMRKSEKFGPLVEKIHMLEIKLPATATEYRPVTVNYPGFAENKATVAILPTLVSYDFSLKSTPYFQRRCSQLARVGKTIRGRLEELRGSGHKQWRATTWELEAGSWKKDPCFFSAEGKQLVADARSGAEPSSGPKLPERRPDVREAQKILNRLGYDVGTADGILGPKTSAGLKKFQQDQGLRANGALNVELLKVLRVRGKLSLLNATSR
ncbi:MAG: peptidoglycan-binding protein [Methyloligellaceae bacterium]